MRLDPNDKQKIYRVINSEDGINGTWWSFEKPPESEDIWRSDMAVLNNFSGGGAFVEVEIPPPEYMLVGKAGPQRSEYDPNKALPGGGIQIYLPQSNYPAPSIPNIQQRVQETGGFRYTPWNAEANALKSVRGGSKIDECEK